MPHVSLAENGPPHRLLSPFWRYRSCWRSPAAVGHRVTPRQPPTSANHAARAQETKPAPTAGAQQLRPSQRRTAETAAEVFAGLQVRGRFADLWRALVPSERAVVAKRTYTRCLAPFHSRATTDFLQGCQREAGPCRPARDPRPRCRHGHGSSPKHRCWSNRFDRPPARDRKVEGRHWYWILDPQALHAYTAGNCPEESC
jgi:hypothetical protein